MADKTMSIADLGTDIKQIRDMVKKKGPTSSATIIGGQQRVAVSKMPACAAQHVPKVCACR